jgi:hypothetical protein
MKKHLFLTVILLIALTGTSSLFGLLDSTENVRIYLPSSGKVKFTSNAPLEMIKAESREIIGSVNLEKNTFEFEVPMKSYYGFNSGLQKRHFNENYMESEKFPSATFVGKIIEDVDLNIPGIYPVRAKGIFTVHGIPMERIIKGTVDVNKNEISIHSNFQVLLNDHFIKIPTIINQKLADIIDVDVNVLLKPLK